MIKNIISPFMTEDKEYIAIKDLFKNIDDILLLPKIEIYKKRNFHIILEGIYFICNNDIIFYIGQSTNLVSRLYTNHIQKSYVKNIHHNIYILLIEKKSLRLRLERYFIKNFKPIYNKTII